MTMIRILDETTANQIAAGEVVERPVNAIKELAENSVDAGSREIEVEIADGGMTYIRVTDDGCGMSGEDVGLSILRHATSKISTVDNIYHIASLGFRGEALPSIVSVSRTKITTREKEADMAYFLSVEGGTITEEGETGAPAGTTVEVRDLFYNVPARKKFLKSDRAESSRINSMVGKLAMANPDIAFRLINNGRTVIETPGTGRIIDVISSLYGTETAGEMLDVSYEGEELFITGAAAKPSLLKSSRQYQTIIVNRRVVESAAITKAVDNAYHSLLPKNGYPPILLHLRVPPETIDVNVHPQKREIKFANEGKIFRDVYHAVLGTLTAQTAPEHIAASMIRVPGHDMPAGTSSDAYRPKEQEQVVTGGEAPVRSTAVGEGTGPVWQQDKGRHAEHPDTWRAPDLTAGQILSKNTIFPQTEEEKPEEVLFEIPEDTSEEPVVPLGQVAECFIVCQKGNDLFIIDQHAAHERIRYDHFASRAEGIPSQQILVPYLIGVDPSDMDMLEGHTELLRELGIVLEQAGPDVVRILETPEDMDQSGTEQALHDILIALHEKEMPSRETLRHRMMAYAACRGAIKAGHSLNIRQMKELISDLFHTSRPFVCPHGRPVIVRFTPEELGRLFHRT